MKKVAIIQQSPIFFDRQATLELAVQWIVSAARQGAQLVVFPEAFIAGYPAWVWRLRPGTDWTLNEQIHRAFVDAAVDIERGDLEPLCAAARDQGVVVVLGFNQRDGALSRATVYNSVAIIDASGELLNCRRKLMPTNPERMVWGFGDGAGLQVVDTAVGRLGALICWENYMPLARYALYAQGLDILVAPTYDSGEAWLGTVQHIAREGRCWVVSAGVALERSDIPSDFPGREQLYGDDEAWINPGDSAVVAPGGAVLAGPMREQKGVLLAEIDVAQALTSRRALDVAGHYSRPDIFTLTVNRQHQSSIKFE